MKFPLVVARKNRLDKLENEIVELKKVQAKGFETIPVYSKQMFTSRTGRLTWSELWEIYEKSSAVRNSVDSLANEISSLPWEVLPKRGKKLNRRIEREIRDATDFFRDPNSNQESLSQIIKKLSVDILVYAGGALEKVKSVSGRKILEIYARDAHTFKVDVDGHGYLKGYRQVYNYQDPVNFKPNEIVYFIFNATTHSVYGFPIIESIIDEIAILLSSNAYISAYFTEDNIPPGVLNMGMIGPVAYDAAKQEFMADRGQLSKEHLRLIYGTPGVEWVEFRRGNQESQLDELRQSVERVVYRNFGVQPIEFGALQGSNRATALVQFKVSRTKTLYPIVNMFNDFFTKELLEDAGYRDLKFNIIKPRFEDEEEISKADYRYINQGVMSINDVRRKKEIHPETIPGGEVYTRSIGGQLIYVKDLSNQGKVEELLMKPDMKGSKNPPPGLQVNR